MIREPDQLVATWLEQEENAMLRMGLFAGSIASIMLFLTASAAFTVWSTRISVVALVLLAIHLSLLVIVLPLRGKFPQVALPLTVAWHLLFFLILYFEEPGSYLTSASGLCLANTILMLFYPHFGRSQWVLFAYLTIVSPLAIWQETAAPIWALINVIGLSTILGFRVIYRMWIITRLRQL